MTMVHFPNGVPPGLKLRHIDLTPPAPTIETKTEIESLGGNLCHVITHVDDVDLAGKNKDRQKEIIKEVKKEWPIKKVSTEFMLGIKREKFVKDGVACVKITQGACTKEHYDK
jgi:hypothetical protein